MQKFLNNFTTTFIASVKDTAVTGTPATELDYGILRISDGAAGTLTNPTGGDFYILTAFKKSGTSETNVEIMKVTAVDNSVVNECRITVQRAQEGTTAKAYVSGDYISLRLTAGGTYQFAQTEDLTKAAVGLGDVDNTADIDKPVSTAQQTALDLKQSTSEKDATGGYAGLTLFKLNLRNAANTITSWFTTAATVARTWTMPDKDGTVAMLSDITGTNSGTNTGDQDLSGKQDVLVSGTNIKTVNSTSLLGSGNIVTGDVTLTGVQSLTNKTITDIVFALTGTTPAFLATNGGVQTWTLSGASTPTNSLTTGQSIILVITPGANTITWPAGTIWTKQGGSGAAPTLFSAGKTSVVLWMVGAVLYGSHLGDNA